jgi:hypothetical protein
MPKVKISEYSATANSNTDVASINIDEGCAPSGINNAIRAVMGHLKDFQQGTNGDPFNGPVNGTVGATTASTANVTTLTTSSTVTHNGGTANGVPYLNGSKVLTTGNALQFDGTNFGINTTTPSTWGRFVIRGASTGTGGKNVSASFSDASTGTLDIAHSSGFVVLDTQSTSTILRIDQGVGNISARFTQYGIGLSTAVPSSGTGITFPATQSASTDANTLDDYEEGTWTPSLTAISGTLTTVVNGTGNYTRIGNSVTVTCAPSITTNGTGGGNRLVISGLPFARVKNSLTGASREDGAVGFVFGISEETTTSINMQKYDATYPGGNGYRFAVSITYLV